MTATEMAEPVALGARMRALRHAMRITQAQVAARMGTGREAVCRMEQGGSSGKSRETGRVWLATVARYCDAIGVSLSELFAPDPARRTSAHAPACASCPAQRAPKMQAGPRT